ncbi:hypothetical protein BX616_003753 [Lobosporangium transversale]|uniref:Zn(2)-C6 fungal-type domain-containing protein n=1 Tax=Lobosporangium transversale TaxID=64571 RepID=A0A1Y2GML4_9FUNG|nr:hypothetical protein BCR41DRAFT_354560 [Lobosporangium transversale]KAF9918962.1 hypothetical protein BX616_003753 [Lobosporangium transversale]ORZ14254.1 hypothetical protein BCR41DRAFT_354560 [Lobosporangium transversale]|eukprot:XP_021880732.1 hypothetical protein BCR41DRAFT_354560 [Lobosporangium transversale]
MADSAPPTLGIALPPTSMLKIRDACLPCRKQRSKCDGQPCCARCARLDLECTYVELVKAPAPIPKEPWQEFLNTTGAKPEALESAPIELLKDQSIGPLQDASTFPWQKSKMSRRRRQTPSIKKCTCPTPPTTVDTAGQDSFDSQAISTSTQSQAHDGAPSDPATESPSTTSSPGSKRRGRSTTGPCRVHNPQTSSKPSRSVTQGVSSSATSSSPGSQGVVGSSASLRHRPPLSNEPVQLPTSVIETSEKINNLSSKLTRLFVFADADQAQVPPPPQLEILQSRSLSPLLQSHLIQLYLAECLPTQPILDAPTFMAQLAEQEFCTPPHPLLIAAMCAAAAKCVDDADVERLWAEQDPPLPNPFNPFFANGEPHVRSTRDMIWSIGDYFAALAKAYLRTELPFVQSPDRSGGMGDPLTVVQGLIMISSWDASVGRQRECRACAALALRIMIAGGWHLMDHPNGDGCTDSRIKMWGTLERELARRCWWTVWIAEKWTAAILTQYVTLHLSLCETLSLPRAFRPGDVNDQRGVLYFQQAIQGAYLCGAIIQLHYHPFEAEDGTEYDHEASAQDVQRLEARLLEIDNHLEAWHNAIPPVLKPDWGQGIGDDPDNTTGYEPVTGSQFFHAGGDWWWRHAMGGLLEMSYLGLKLLLHQPQHVVSKAPSPLSRLALAQYANKITLTCERMWQYPTTRPAFYHMAGIVLWLALCYQQENTLSDNPRIRTPACVNMQKSYYLVKKAGRLVHSNEDEPLTELETTNGPSASPSASPSNVPFMRPTDEQRVKPMMAVFKEMFPIMRQALRDKGFGLRTQPKATSKVSPFVLIQNPSSPSTIDNAPGVDSLGSASTVSSISVSAASVMGATTGSGPSSFYLAPLTPPGTSTCTNSPMTESLGSVPSPSPPPSSLVSDVAPIPTPDSGQMYVGAIDSNLQQVQQPHQYPQHAQVALFPSHTSPSSLAQLQFTNNNQVRVPQQQQMYPSLHQEHQAFHAQHHHQQQQRSLQSQQSQHLHPFHLAQGLSQPSTPVALQQPLQHASTTSLTDPLNAILNMNSDPFSSIMQNEPNVLSSLIDYSEWLNHSLE